MAKTELHVRWVDLHSVNTALLNFQIRCISKYAVYPNTLYFQICCPNTTLHCCVSKYTPIPPTHRLHCSIKLDANTVSNSKLQVPKITHCARAVLHVQWRLVWVVGEIGGLLSFIKCISSGSSPGRQESLRGRKLWPRNHQRLHLYAYTHTYMHTYTTYTHIKCIYCGATIVNYCLRSTSTSCWKGSWLWSYSQHACF